MPAALDFWFDFASTYSYPAAVRIAAAGRARRRARCASGRSCSGRSSRRRAGTTSPFNLYPAKGRYMWRDLERLCADLDAAVPPARSVSAEQPAGGARRAGRARRKAGARTFASRSSARSSATAAGSTTPATLDDILSRLAGRRRRPCSPRRNRTTTRRGCARRPRRRSGSACSARRASRPRTANCSGATTGSNSALRLGER